MGPGGRRVPPRAQTATGAGCAAGSERGPISIELGGMPLHSTRTDVRPDEPRHHLSQRRSRAAASNCSADRCRRRSRRRWRRQRRWRLRPTARAPPPRQASPRSWPPAQPSVTARRARETLGVRAVPMSISSGRLRFNDDRAARARAWRCRLNDPQGPGSGGVKSRHRDGPEDVMRDFARHLLGPNAEELTRQLIARSDTDMRVPARSMLAQLRRSRAPTSRVPAP
jgi:hypothetical protein